MSSIEMSRAVAIVGMSCRFPGADDPAAYWHNLLAKREARTELDEETLRKAGVSEALLADSRYVRSCFAVADIDLFDAEFFGFTAREAQLLDPQQRLFLECVWHALEDAGHVPEKYPGRIGVYAGVFSSVYLLNLYSHPDLVETVGELAVRHANEKDYLATRASYKLNLRGPSVTLQTSCSTSLVAVHAAAQSLLAGECDLAVAGAVQLAERDKGYLYQAGGLMSPDGRCRPFDAAAGGTVFGSGAGVVVLKRLEDAVREGNSIYAVIKGSAINNDGADKVGFTAPSVNGQAEVILEALAMAEVAAESVGLVEAHGTGTPLGDPIEIEALTRAWRTQTEQRGTCAIGSAKANVGHLGAAAGVAGLIKAALALHHRVLPPAMNFETPNPAIDFAASPFFVNTEARPWAVASGAKRRAAVSSFGMGGTNAHVVLEEAPAVAEAVDEAAAGAVTGDAADAAAARWAGEELLVLSARSEAAVKQAAGRLGAHLAAHPGLALRDVAATLREGRRELGWRAAVVASGTAQASERLRALASANPSARQAAGAPSLAFVFPGQGAQYPGACRGLYQAQPVYREQFDRCAALVARAGGPALSPDGEAGADTAVVQPLLFAMEHALAQLLLSLGLAPAAMLGHSLGEYVAACLAGVMSLEEAARLVVQRGRLMQGTAAGKMLAVPLGEEALSERLRGLPGVALAAVNGPAQCVVSGAAAAVARLAAVLQGEGVKVRELATARAFHSPLMEPILEEFQREVEQVALRPPSIPFVSNLSGAWITAAQATSPAYWTEHLRRPVRFAEGVGTLLAPGERVLVEVGPGTTLTGLLRAHPMVQGERVVAVSRHARDQASDAATWLKALGELWCCGVALPAGALGEGKRVALPGYPFERKRYWIERRHAAPVLAAAAAAAPLAAAAPPLEVASPAAEPAEALAPASSASAAAAAPAAALPDVDSAVRELWKTLFGTTTVHDDDDFFASGGTSLVAMQMIARVRETFGVELSIESLFDDPTVRGITAQIRPLLAP